MAATTPNADKYGKPVAPPLPPLTNRNIMTFTEQTFLRDVKDHTVTVIRNDGVHRHIRFQKPGTMCMHFDLITWPGYLCYTGDMGTYVFSRLRDMFKFFRVDQDSQWLKSRGLTLGINPSYWGEKLEATDKCDGLKKFDDAKFDRIVKDYLVRWIRDNADCTSKEERRELWDEVMYEVISADGDSGGFRKTTAAYDFHHQVNRSVKFEFQDLWEYDFTDYTHRFMWCCYALAWGIKQFDALTTPEPALAA